jgi:hypothetical protein
MAHCTAQMLKEAYIGYQSPEKIPSKAFHDKGICVCACQEERRDNREFGP